MRFHERAFERELKRLKATGGALLKDKAAHFGINKKRVKNDYY